MKPDELIGHHPFLLCFHRNTLVGCLACPPGTQNTVWVRIFAAQERGSPKRLWERVWQVAKRELLNMGVGTVAVLVISPWFEPLLIDAQFQVTNGVIFLEWRRQQEARRVSPNASIRECEPADLDQIIELDNRAFQNIWRNSPFELSAAFRQASYATVYMVEGNLVGYQLSTTSAWGAHLARLAVDPAWQRRGIGSALVVDLIQQMSRLGLSRVTVNTQEDNRNSIRLYYNLGFVETGDRYPIYELTLPT
jgi:ribosomal-protein-alanine N-acetyltransferase